MFDDRVMSGCDVIAAERFGFPPKISKLQFLVAHHARIWRATGLIFAGEIIDHGALELIGFIDHVVGNA